MKESDILAVLGKKKHGPRRKLSEAEVTSQVVGYMQTLGYRPERQQSVLMNVDGRRIRIGSKGASDWIMTHPTRPAVYVEIKREGCTIPSLESLYLSDRSKDHVRHAIEQQEYLRDRRIEGFRAFWCNSIEMAKLNMS